MIFRRHCSVSQYRYVSQGKPSVCHYLQYRKKLVLGRVMSQFLVNFFWLAVLEIFIGEPYSIFFGKVFAAKKFIKNRGGRGRREYHDFRSKSFVSDGRNFSHGNPCVSETFRYRKMLGKKGDGYHNFPSKLFCLTVPKNFLVRPFCVSRNFWYRKTIWIRVAEDKHDFPPKLFVSQYQIIS